MTTDPTREKIARLTSAQIKALWTKYGGRQHGPHVEQYYIEEQAFYRFATDICETTLAIQPDLPTPDEWREVPVEPTEEMKRAWDDQANVTAYPWSTFTRRYAAMLQASPQPLSPKAHPLARMTALDEELEQEHPGWMTGEAAPERKHVMPGDPANIQHTALQWYLDFDFGHPHSVRESNIAIEAFKDGYRAALRAAAAEGGVSLAPGEQV